MYVLKKGFNAYPRFQVSGMRTATSAAQLHETRISNTTEHLFSSTAAPCLLLSSLSIIQRRGLWQYLMKI